MNGGNRMENLQEKSNEIRRKLIEFHKRTGRGHVGCGLSAVEILTTLYYGIMTEKDSFILSKGHACGALYVVLNDMGKLPTEEMEKLEEHPKRDARYGIEASTGSLGHGLSMGIGIALAKRLDNENGKVYVLMGDGECDEGQVWEAARVASERKLDSIVGIVDCNGFQCFRKADYSGLYSKFHAFGWDPVWCNGHDCTALFKTLSEGEKNMPRIILAETVKGKGMPEIENTLKSHYFHFQKT